MKLQSTLKLVLRGLAPAALLLAFAAPRIATAQASATQDHVVSSQALDQQLTTNSATRQQNIETLQNLMETPTAQKAMHDAKVDPQQVKSAIPTLTNDELANLSARVNKANSDLAAGHIGPGLFTIVILVVILIIIIIVVKA
jgi:exonuclease VII large subunit